MKRLYFTILVAIGITITGGIIDHSNIFGKAGHELIIYTTIFLAGIVTGVGMTKVNVKKLLVEKECSFLE